MAKVLVLHCREEAEAQRGRETCLGSHSYCKEAFPTSVLFLPPAPAYATLSLQPKNVWGKQAANLPISSGQG